METIKDTVYSLQHGNYQRHNVQPTTWKLSKTLCTAYIMADDKDTTYSLQHGNYQRWYMHGNPQRDYVQPTIWKSSKTLCAAYNMSADKDTTYSLQYGSFGVIVLVEWSSHDSCQGCFVQPAPYHPQITDWEATYILPTTFHCDSIRGIYLKSYFMWKDLERLRLWEQYT